MRVPVVGAGGVGSAVARTVARWDLFASIDEAGVRDRANLVVEGYRPDCCGSPASA